MIVVRVVLTGMSSTPSLSDSPGKRSEATADLDAIDVLRRSIRVVRDAPVILGIFVVAAPLGALLGPIGSLVDLLAIGFATGLAYNVYRGRVTGDVSVPVRLLLVLVSGLISGALVVIGFVALILPGLYALSKLYLATTAIMVDGVGPIEALSESADRTDGHALTVLGYALVGGVLSGGISIPLTVVANMGMARSITRNK
jgi:hypothetical protein